MANDNIPRGLVPLNWPSLPVHYYRVSTGADLFLGMPVTLAADGYIGPVADVASAGAVRSIGVVVGFAGVLKRGLATNDPYLDVSDLTPPTPSSDTGDRWVAVADDPNQEFVMQEDTGGTALALADAGLAIAGLYRASSGNTDTGWANLEIDADSGVASNSGAFLLLRLHDLVNSDGTENAVGDYAKWVVQLLHHQKRSGINPIPA